MINSYRTLTCTLLGVLLTLAGVWHSELLISVIITLLVPWPFVISELAKLLEEIHHFIVWAREERELKKYGVTSSQQRGAQH